MDEFDVVVIGAGPASEAAAGRCADGGLSVALVERELVSGECSYWGCVPSKTLIRPGDVLAAARRVSGAREAVMRGVDVAAALAQRDYMTSGWKDDGQLPWLAEHGITLVRGAARLDGPRSVLVDETRGYQRQLFARDAVVVATGTSAALPPIGDCNGRAPLTHMGKYQARIAAAAILVGATFTGPGVQELLHSATVAIAGEVPIERLWHAVPSFPHDQRGMAAPARSLRIVRRHSHA